MEVRDIPIGELQISNGGLAVRHVKDEAAVKDLAGNIAVFGLIQPLLVKETLKGFIVVDGNQRLKALRLQKEPPATVPCVVDPSAGVGHGLSANTMRADMNPMDRYDAFSKLMTSGFSVVDLARAYGVKQREVEQILALAALAPSIKDKVRADKLKYETAEALTLVRDHKLQEKLLQTCGDSDWKIRQAVRDAKPMLRHALFEQKQYEIAGGTFIVDLFDKGFREDEGLVCADDEIFWKLQEPAIFERIGELQKEGWKAVVKLAGPLPHAHYNWPLARNVKKADRPNHTLRYDILPTGELHVEDYAEPAKAAKKAATSAAKTAKQEPAAAPKRPESYAGDGLRAFPQALTAELAYHRGCQVKEAILAGPTLLGLRTLAYMLVIKEKNAEHYIQGPGDLVWSDSGVKGDEATNMPRFDAAEKAFAKIAKLGPSNGSAKLWGRLAKATREDLVEILSYVAAGIFDGKTLGSWELGARILAERPIDGRRTFQPTAAFWEQTSKGYMVGQLQAVLGPSLKPHIKSSFANMKGADLAELLGRWFTDPAKITSHQLDLEGKTIPAELQKKFKAWVPHALELPTEAEARKAQAAVDADAAE